jgi:hypothetical protein
MARFTREICRFQSIKVPMVRILFRGYKSQKVQKRSFFNKIGNNEATLTVDGAFYSENLLISKP